MMITFLAEELGTITLLFLSGLLYLWSRHWFPPGPSYTSCWLCLGLFAVITQNEDIQRLFWGMSVGLVCSWYLLQVSIPTVWRDIVRFWDTEVFTERRVLRIKLASLFCRASDISLHATIFLVAGYFWGLNITVRPWEIIRVVIFERWYFWCIEGRLIGHGVNTGRVYEVRPLAPPLYFYKLQLLVTLGYGLALSSYVEAKFGLAVKVLWQAVMASAILVSVRQREGKEIQALTNMMIVLFVRPWNPQASFVRMKDGFLTRYNKAGELERIHHTIDHTLRVNDEKIYVLEPQRFPLVKSSLALRALVYGGCWGPTLGMVSRVSRVMQRILLWCHDTGMIDLGEKQGYAMVIPPRKGKPYASSPDSSAACTSPGTPLSSVPSKSAVDSIKGCFRRQADDELLWQTAANTLRPLKLAALAALPAPERLLPVSWASKKND